MLPKLFALTRKTDDEASRIVGYGMVLPDGSAHSVSWPGPSRDVGLLDQQRRRTAELRRADLLWLGDQT